MVYGKDGSPTLLFDPEVPAGLQAEHVKDLADLPDTLDYSDKIRVRYSENKVYLFQYLSEGHAGLHTGRDLSRRKHSPS